MVGRVEIIPEEWKMPVLEILRRKLTNREIDWEPNARTDWATYGMLGDAYQSMIAALEPAGTTGRIDYKLSDGKKTTWDFLFQHPGAPFIHYGKISLYKHQVKIHICSTHKAEKPTL